MPLTYASLKKSQHRQSQSNSSQQRSPLRKDKINSSAKGIRQSCLLYDSRSGSRKSKSRSPWKNGATHQQLQAAALTTQIKLKMRDNRNQSSTISIVSKKNEQRIPTPQDDDELLVTLTRVKKKSSKQRDSEEPNSSKQSYMNTLEEQLKRNPHSGLSRSQQAGPCFDKALTTYKAMRMKNRLSPPKQSSLKSSQQRSQQRSPQKSAQKSPSKSPSIRSVTPNYRFKLSGKHSSVVTTAKKQKAACLSLSKMSTDASTAKRSSIGARTRANHKSYWQTGGDNSSAVSGLASGTATQNTDAVVGSRETHSPKKNRAKKGVLQYKRVGGGYEIDQSKTITPPEHFSRMVDQTTQRSTQCDVTKTIDSSINAQPFNQRYISTTQPTISEEGGVRRVKDEQLASVVPTTLSPYFTTIDPKSPHTGKFPLHSSTTTGQQSQRVSLRDRSTSRKRKFQKYKKQLMSHCKNPFANQSPSKSRSQSRSRSRSAQRTPSPFRNRSQKNTSISMSSPAKKLYATYHQCRKRIDHKRLQSQDSPNFSNLTSTAALPFRDQEGEDFAEYFINRSSGNSYGNNQIKVEFEPTESYMHEVMKFRHKHASTRDKVKSINEATKFWDVDKFLNNAHKKPFMTDKSREGRKLGIAEYDQKMKLKVYGRPKSSGPLKKPPTYVIPSEKKRDEIRYNIRMKMLRSSAITFKSSLDMQQDKKKKNVYAKVTGKITRGIGQIYQQGVNSPVHSNIADVMSISHVRSHSRKSSHVRSQSGKNNSHLTTIKSSIPEPSHFAKAP